MHLALEAAHLTVRIGLRWGEQGGKPPDPYRQCLPNPQSHQVAAYAAPTDSGALLMCIRKVAQKVVSYAELTIDGVLGGDPVTCHSIDGDGRGSLPILDPLPARGSACPIAHTPETPRRLDQHGGHQGGKYQRGDPGFGHGQLGQVRPWTWPTWPCVTLAGQVRPWIWPCVTLPGQA